MLNESCTFLYFLYVQCRHCSLACFYFTYKKTFYLGEKNLHFMTKMPSASNIYLYMPYIYIYIYIGTSKYEENEMLRTHVIYA